MPKDAIFRLKSMSKPVVTVAALVLFDDGKFGLDDLISNHLPEWKESKVSEGDKLVPARKPIIPRMLMTHSSGLYYQLPGKLSRDELPAAVFNRLDKNKDGVVTIDELKALGKSR